jgi:hypothetical protein
MSSLWKMAAHWNGAWRMRQLQIREADEQTYAVHSLTGGTVAILRCQGLVPAQLVLHSAAVTFALPFDRKVLCLVVNAIRRSVFPLIFLAMGGGPGLVLVGVVAAAALVPLFTSLRASFLNFGHLRQPGRERKRLAVRKREGCSCRRELDAKACSR